MDEVMREQQARAALVLHIRSRVARLGEQPICKLKRALSRDTINTTAKDAHGFGHQTFIHLLTSSSEDQGIILLCLPVYLPMLCLYTRKHNGRTRYSIECLSDMFLMLKY